MRISYWSSYGCSSDLLQGGDIDFLDISEMWNMALGCSHVLSDAPAQANNFNLFIRTDGRCPGRPIAFSLSIEQIGVQVGMANALSLGMNHRQIDPKRLCPRPACGRSEDFGRCLIAILDRKSTRLNSSH